MIVAVPKEVVAGERRVALVPELVPKLVALGLEVVVEPGAGMEAGFADTAYRDKGARLEADVLGRGDVVLKVQPLTRAEIDRLKEGAVVIGFLAPYANAEGVRALAERRITAFAMELMPRITRAQPMDALSAMSTVAGYKAVLIAANHLPKFFPLLMTAAGTMTAARVFIIGAGVAGLQAIATSRRLGARVEAYDVRPAVKEQIQSLGARFVELPIEAGDAQDAGGYAKAQDESFYRRQREMMLKTVAATDVVISTAAIPGKRAPILITEEMVKAMPPGSAIVDLAAATGGNCELTVADQTVVRHGVTIIGPTNLPATVPYHASQMYARNVVTLIQHLVRRDKGPDGKPTGAPKLVVDANDEITKEILVTSNGEIVHPRLREAVRA
jgi:proton-translocating NAD(P)+ transhydrogenase subunit alpha